MKSEECLFIIKVLDDKLQQKDVLYQNFLKKYADNQNDQIEAQVFCRDLDKVLDELFAPLFDEKSIELYQKSFYCINF